MTVDLRQQIDELYNKPPPASLRQKWTAFIDSDSPGARLTRGTLVFLLLLGLPIIGLLFQLLAGLFFAAVLVVAAIALFLFISW
jgi:hypothetical protein